MSLTVFLPDYSVGSNETASLGLHQGSRLDSSGIILLLYLVDYPSQG